MQKMHIYLSLQSTKCIADWFSLKGNILSFLPCPLTLCEYPTTADSATAGHWFCHRSHNHDHLHTKVKGLNIQLWVKLIISNCHSYTLVQNCLGTTFKLIINTKTFRTWPLMLPLYFCLLMKHLVFLLWPLPHFLHWLLMIQDCIGVASTTPVLDMHRCAAFNGCHICSEWPCCHLWKAQDASSPAWDPCKISMRLCKRSEVSLQEVMHVSFIRT